MAPARRAIGGGNVHRVGLRPGQSAVEGRIGHHAARPRTVLLSTHLIGESEGLFDRETVGALATRSVEAVGARLERALATSGAA